jgi:glyoxylate reductase
METARPTVFVTRRLPAAAEAAFAARFDARWPADDRPMTVDELAAALREADVLVPTISDRIDAHLIAQAGPRLKLVANYGNGTDHIDVASAQARGITVTNTPDVLTDDTADMAMALILAVPRRLAEGIAVMRQPDSWPGWSPTWMLGGRLAGRKLGIIGMGRIGQAVARRARAFGMTIHYHNRHRLPEAIEGALEATYFESLDQMLARMDVVSVHCPHTPATYHLLSARRLKLMRPDAYLVNTARGEVIDENALARMIEANELAGAGLDVFEREPMVNPGLVLSRKVTLLPHMGSATLEGRIAMGEKVIANIEAFVAGHLPPNRVLPAGP